MEIYPGIRNNPARLDWVNRLLAEGISVPTLIHPTAYVSPTAVIGPGSVVLPNAMVGTNVKIGKGGIVNMGGLVDHDSVIEGGAQLGPAAIVKAENRIPALMKVESGLVNQNRQYPI